MIKKCFFMLITCILFSACTKGDTTVDVLTKKVEIIEEGKLYFDCSEEMNKTKGDNINSIGYLCSVFINEQTTLSDINDQLLTLNEFKVGDVIKIYFSTPQIINENNKSFVAKEIMRIESNT